MKKLIMRFYWHFKISLAVYTFCYLYQSFTYWRINNFFQFFIDMPKYSAEYRFGFLFCYLSAHLILGGLYIARRDGLEEEANKHVKCINCGLYMHPTIGAICMSEQCPSKNSHHE